LWEQKANDLFLLFIYRIVHPGSIIRCNEKVTLIRTFSERRNVGPGAPFASLNAASANREEARQRDGGFIKSQCCFKTL